VTAIGTVAGVARCVVIGTDAASGGLDTDIGMLLQDGAATDGARGTGSAAVACLWALFGSAPDLT
jgi:hypothetical protein